MRLRRWTYNHQILRPGGTSVPVIVIGNLSVGGTGKSPLVLALANYLTQQGWQPGIISRGYGGEELPTPTVVSDQHSALQVGDEALMMCQLTEAPVAVCRDRRASCQLLVDQHGCDIIVSDDGFQHMKLKRDIDIVVVDGQRGFGNGWCLPSGPLRESTAALSDASILVVNVNQGERCGVNLQSVGQSLSQPVFEMRIAGKPLYALADRDKTRSLHSFSDEPVHAFAGLGNPQRFFQLLEKAGLHIEGHAFFDHHQFEALDFATVAEGQPVILTEKDAVKCQHLLAQNRLAPELAERIWVLPVVAELQPEFYAAVDQRLAALSITAPQAI